MLIVGCDYHPGFQQIAFVDSETGELRERRLAHRGEAEQFYTGLKGQRVRVGMEASGHGRWFERLLGELHFELWIGNAAEIRTKRVRKQKTDRQDAQLLLRLMVDRRELATNARKLGSKKARTLRPLPYKRTFAWVLKNARRLKTPVRYRHPSGCIIWVNLGPGVQAAISRQLKSK